MKISVEMGVTMRIQNGPGKADADYLRANCGIEADLDGTDIDTIESLSHDLGFADHDKYSVEDNQNVIRAAVVQELRTQMGHLLQAFFPSTRS